MTGPGPFLPGEPLLLAGLATFALVCLAIIFWPGVRAYRAIRGTRVVTCPLTGTPAAVKLDALEAIATAMAGQPLALSIARCTRWPALARCQRPCLEQIGQAIGQPAAQG